MLDPRVVSTLAAMCFILGSILLVVATWMK
jgi:hypothetical protein